MESLLISSLSSLAVVYHASLVLELRRRHSIRSCGYGGAYIARVRAEKIGVNCMEELQSVPELLPMMMCPMKQAALLFVSSVLLVPANADALKLRIPTSIMVLFSLKG